VAHPAALDVILGNVIVRYDIIVSDVPALLDNVESGSGSALFHLQHISICSVPPNAYTTREFDGIFCIPKQPPGAKALDLDVYRGHPYTEEANDPQRSAVDNPRFKFRTPSRAYPTHTLSLRRPPGTVSLLTGCTLSGRFLYNQHSDKPADRDGSIVLMDYLP
jgi:hypothetical protein